MVDYGAAISLSQGLDMSQTSDEDTPRSVPPISFCTEAGPSKAPKLELVDHQVVAARKPRGRPPGSKNKPKPAIIITKESESAIKSAVIEIAAGSDLVEMLVTYARRRHVCLSAMGATGSVANVTLRNPVLHAPPLSLRGPLNVLSLYGTILVGSSGSSPPCFSITLAGAQGQVFGGVIGGKVMTASSVMVMAATFQNPSFHRLPAEIEEADQEKEAAAAMGGENESMYNVGAEPTAAQVSDHVLSWAPPSRPSHF